MTGQSDEYWMQRALTLARSAAEQGEVPVAALIVRNDALVSEAANAPITRCDPTAHAEILALQQAGQSLDNYRLLDCTMYVTLEPCSMCAGALVHARLSRLVFAAPDPRTGAVVSQQALLDADYHNHRVAWQGGVLADESAALLRAFFRSRR